MKPIANSGSFVSPTNPQSAENVFENVKKLSDVFELKTDIDLDVFFEETDDDLPALVWYPEFKLSETCREVYAAALNCPAQIKEDHLIISVEKSGKDSQSDLVLELLSILTGDCSISVYDRMVISQ